MNNPRALLLSLLLTLLPATLTRAQTGITGKIATTGLGFDITRPLAEPLNLRFGYNLLGLVTDYDFEDNIKADLHLESIPLLLDWHLFDGHFRLTAGVFYNQNAASLIGRANSTVEVNNTRYRVESYQIDFEVEDFAPYIGFGWGRAIDPDHRFAFAFDFGILFQGEATVTGRAVAASPAIQAQLDRDFSAELDSRTSDASDLELYPVISLGLSYRF